MLGFGLNRITDRIRERGYLQTPDAPTHVDAKLTAAIQACMLDESCWQGRNEET